MKNDSHAYHMLQGITGKLFLLITQLTLCLGIVSVGQAATTTFNVNSFSDIALGASAPCDGAGTCTLRAAVQKANATSNSTDALGVVQPHIINLPAGTYTLSTTGINEDQAATGDLDISGTVNIVGGNLNDPSQTIIDGNASDRVLQIKSGATVSLSNLTVQNGYVDADINDNVAIGGGGGGGGGIYTNGKLRIENCVIQNNKVVSVNAPGAGGGGLQTTGVSGTGPNPVQTNIIHSTISNNSAPLGGGIRNFFGFTKIDYTDVYNNTADAYSGGGVQNANGNMTITRSTIRYNTSQQTGGGLDNLDALSISESSIYLNQVNGIMTGGTITQGGAGGGIYNGSVGSILMVNTTISQNQAALSGGGIYNHRAIIVVNSTIFGNSVANGGSGTEVFACGSGTSQNPSSCNTDITDGNGNFLIKTDFINSIVGNSITTDNCNGDTADLINSNGHNIETAANTCGFTQSGDQNNVPPATLFSDVLGYYGGDLGSLFTLPILSSSLAYNSGDNTNDNCPATDGRYFSRSDGQCDIGAFEFGATPSAANVLDLALDITDKVAAPLNGAVQVTVTFSVVNKGPLQATNVVLTGSIPFQSGLNLTSLGSESNTGNCTQSTTGFTCTIPSINAYDSANFFVALIATKALNFQIGGEAKSDQVDNYRPDNLKSVTIEIPTVAGSSVSGNNFAGASGGGATDWLSLLVLFPAAARRLQRRKRSG